MGDFNIVFFDSKYFNINILQYGGFQNGGFQNGGFQIFNNEIINIYIDDNSQIAEQVSGEPLENINVFDIINQNDELDIKLNNFIVENPQKYYSINIFNSFLINNILQTVEYIYGGNPLEDISILESINRMDGLNIKIDNFIIDLRNNNQDNIFIQYILLLINKRRMMESYLGIKNNFIISDERTMEDLIINTYVKSPEDIVFLTDDVLVLETAVFQLIDVFDEIDSLNTLKLIIRLDWGELREKYLANKWREDLKLKINL
jgi:hypothetical protein